MAHVTINPKMLYYGFPVVLLTTIDKEGKTNISPLSSSWCLGNPLVIGLGTDGKAYENIGLVPEVVLNVASNELMAQIENIAKLTGKKSVSVEKTGQGYSYSDDKFSAGGFTRQSSISVKPERIKECKIQIEALVEKVSPRDWYAIVEREIKSVHADSSILIPNNYIDPTIWNPLVHSFRSYHRLSEQLGRNFRFEN